MGNTQHSHPRQIDQTAHRSRGFQKAAVALLVAFGTVGCSTTNQQVTAYTPPAEATPMPATAPALTPTETGTWEVSEAAPAPATAAAIALRDDRPSEYVVVKGDTLWDISAKFLNDPFQWPRVWKQNPQIKNPHLIYPGDLVRLSVVDGRTVIDVLRPDGAGGYNSVSSGADAGARMRNGREVLSPGIHESELVRSVSNEAAEAIRNFSKSPHVVATDELQNAAYVLSATDHRLASANGDTVFARGFNGELKEAYGVFRPSTPLIDPETGITLGYEAKRVADAKLSKGGDPATLRLFNSTQETLKGDRLVAKQEQRFDNPTPVAVDPSVSGRVISLYDAMTHAGQHQVVVLNKGRSTGMQAGALLEIASANTAVFDDQANNGEGEYIELPTQMKGNAIVFRAFDNVSYALILEATDTVNVGDTLRGF